jgi:hypothetical protein
VQVRPCSEPSRRGSEHGLVAFEQHKFHRFRPEAWLARLEEEDEQRHPGDARYQATARHRDLDGRLREVKATARSGPAASALLKTRLQERSGFRGGGVLHVSSPFGDLADLWLAAELVLLRADCMEPTM